VLILALDTSSKAASCALWREGVLLGESFLNCGLTHSQTIMPMVQGLLCAASVSLDEVDRYAVSVGPGSFTGLRIGLSAVKGMAMAADKPCAPVSTLEALAWNLCAFRGIIAPVMDARRAQVYTALFQSDGALPRRLREDAALPIPALGRRLQDLGDTPVMLVGDGAAMCLEALGGASARLLIAPEPLRHQRAGSVAAVAAHTGAAVGAAQLEPAYLRLPQAQRELIEKKGGTTV